MRTLVAALCLLAFAADVFAQAERAGPPQNVQMRIGPLYVNPTIALTNAGVDTNVFNESTGSKRDFTVTVTPATDLWLRVGPTWLQARIREDLVWFEKYASERSANNAYSVTWDIPLNRLRLIPTFGHVNTRQRPGFEIDTRAQRTELNYGGTIEVAALSKLFFSATANQVTTEFDGAAEFLGINLRDELNRKITTGQFSVRDQLTPLTSIAAGVTIEQDRFDFDHLRDSDSRGIDFSVRFDPAALLKGSASFGYRDFKPLNATLPAYRGSTAAVDLSYVLLGVTKLGVTATRNVQYSYDINQPYYVLTGATVAVTQQIFGPVDVIARGGLQRLEYRDRAGAAVAISDRVDHIQTFGGGIGYHLGRDTRIGFNIDQSRRLSGITVRQFNGLSYGFAVTYGS
jgi:hypothetical protein